MRLARCKVAQFASASGTLTSSWDQLCPEVRRIGHHRRQRTHLDEGYGRCGLENRVEVVRAKMSFGDPFQAFMQVRAFTGCSVSMC